MLLGVYILAGERASTKKCNIASGSWGLDLTRRDRATAGLSLAQRGEVVFLKSTLGLS